MYNWNTDTTRLKKSAADYQKFSLEQKINFGLNESKISRKKLKKYWHQINIDPAKRNYLEKILWAQS